MATQGCGAVLPYCDLKKSPGSVSSSGRPINVVLVPDQQAMWNSWHTTSHEPDPEPLHRRFTERFIRALPPAAVAQPILKLGCGQGHDALLIASSGYSVYGLDFSPVALEQARKYAEAHPGLHLRFRCHDTSKPLPFQDGELCGVYSYLSLHYFTDAVTRAVFREIHRVLRPGGILAFCVKSTDDPLHGKGIQLEQDMYCLDGHVRHFFSPDYIRGLLRGWQILFLSEVRTNYLRSDVPSGTVQTMARKPDDSTGSATGVYVEEG
jgi:SAM-dependent methyltransferase